MIRNIAILVLALGCGVIDLQASPQTSLKTFTLEELIPLQADFFPDRITVQWISDTEYISSDMLSVKKYDALSGNYSSILSLAELLNLSRFDVESFSNDQKYVLLTTNKKKVYRYSSIAEYSVYNLAQRSIASISHGLLQVVQWCSDTSLAFVQNNNVYYIPNIAKPDVITALTTDGTPGNIYHGVTDWIYEEEVFNSAEAMWSSPSGSYLAVASFNDTLVETAIYPYYGEPNGFDSQYPLLVQFKYPKAGRTNPDVRLRVFNLNDLNAEAMSIPAPVDVVGLDHILGRVNWATDQNLIVLWLNRRQSISVLMDCDLKLDKCSILKQETEPNGWIDIHAPFFDETGTQMLEVQPLPYNDQRFMHVGRLNFDTLVTEDLTPGNSTVTELLGWHQPTDTVYYILSPGTEPWKRQLWASTKGNVKCITCSKAPCQTVDAMFSPGGSFGIITCSATNIPPTSYFFTSQTETFKLLTDNSKLVEKMSQYKAPMTLFNKMSLEEDTMSLIKLMLPPEMEPGKKYPMIIRLYSGPGSTRVRDSFDLEYYNMYLSSNRSFIVAAIDVRGSSVMGVEAMHALNNALGTVEITDTLAAIKRLLSNYAFIDSERVGIWGWSYGGFAASMVLVKDEHRLVSCGAAVAPVSSWLYYDSIYTERYMDTPQNNPVGYKNSDLLSMAEKLRGRRYLLIHGTADDNVHYQHSMQLAKRLQRADIPFEQMSYADENHSLRGVSRHFYHTLDRFWTECFYS